jgi:hypothetical protein
MKEIKLMEIVKFGLIVELLMMPLNMDVTMNLMKLFVVKLIKKHFYSIIKKVLVNLLELTKINIFSMECQRLNLTIT